MRSDRYRTGRIAGWARQALNRSLAAMTLVEVMAAAAILFIVVWGTIAFATAGRVKGVQSGQRRTAAQIGAERLDLARGQGYEEVSAGAGSVLLDGTTYSWTVSVAPATADPADGGSVFKTIEVTVDWVTSGNQPVTLRSAIAP